MEKALSESIQKVHDQKIMNKLDKTLWPQQNNVKYHEKWKYL